MSRNKPKDVAAYPRTQTCQETAPAMPHLQAYGLHEWQSAKVDTSVTGTRCTRLSQEGTRDAHPDPMLRPGWKTQQRRLKDETD